MLTWMIVEDNTPKMCFHARMCLFGIAEPEFKLSPFPQKIPKKRLFWPVFSGTCKIFAPNWL